MLEDMKTDNIVLTPHPALCAVAGVGRGGGDGGRAGLQGEGSAPAAAALLHLQVLLSAARRGCYSAAAQVPRGEGRLPRPLRAARGARGGAAAADSEHGGGGGALQHGLVQQGKQCAAISSIFTSQRAATTTTFHLHTKLLSHRKDCTFFYVLVSYLISEH